MAWTALSWRILVHFSAMDMHHFHVWKLSLPLTRTRTLLRQAHIVKVKKVHDLTKKMQTVACSKRVLLASTEICEEREIAISKTVKIWPLALRLPKTNIMNELKQTIKLEYTTTTT